jgi:hypothetical protein
LRRKGQLDRTRFGQAGAKDKPGKTTELPAVPQVPMILCTDVLCIGIGRLDIGPVRGRSGVVTGRASGVACFRKEVGYALWGQGCRRCLSPPTPGAVAILSTGRAVLSGVHNRRTTGGARESGGLKEQEGGPNGAPGDERGKRDGRPGSRLLSVWGQNSGLQPLPGRRSGGNPPCGPVPEAPAGKISISTWF